MLKGQMWLYVFLVCGHKCVVVLQQCWHVNYHEEWKSSLQKQLSCEVALQQNPADFHWILQLNGRRVSLSESFQVHFSAIMFSHMFHPLELVMNTEYFTELCKNKNPLPSLPVCSLFSLRQIITTVSRIEMLEKPLPKNQEEWRVQSTTGVESLWGARSVKQTEYTRSLHIAWNSGLHSAVVCATNTAFHWCRISILELSRNFVFWRTNTP